MEGYGLTETSPVVTWSTGSGYKKGSVGKPLPGVKVLIVDEEERPLTTGREGEILVSGPNVMAGYYRDEELTRLVMTTLAVGCRGRSATTRFLRTGDIGKLDEEGRLYITGRKKEMMIVGGLNVFPRTVEEVLNSHPAVKDSAVVGRRDEWHGEVPVAAVEVREGHEFDEADLRSWCRERLAGYEVPRGIYQVELLPRAPSGKVLRRKVREMLAVE